MKKLEILITEDNAKHLADAKSISRQYTNIEFTFASTLQEAENLVEQKKFDAVVTDVFFPIQESLEPTSDSGLGLARKVDEKGIPFVYNTSGNHHGRAYVPFLEASIKMWDNDDVGTGKMIESYPENPNGEKDTKQWNAAINYVILLTRLPELEKSVKHKLNLFLRFAPYGDRGKLTTSMQRVLDESLSLDDINREINISMGMPQECPWGIDALMQGMEEGKLGTKSEDYTWNGKNDCFVSLRATKEEDEAWFRETETKIRNEYVGALEFIRKTLTKYRK